MGPTTYEILHPEKGKPKQTYHVNLLKTWVERSSPSSVTSLLVCEVIEEDDYEGVVEAWKQPENVDLSHLDGKKPFEPFVTGYVLHLSPAVCTETWPYP